MSAGNTICFVSCIGDVADSHTVKYMTCLLQHGFSVLSIRPGTIDKAPVLKQFPNFRHIQLPEITSNFWPEGSSIGSVVSGLKQRAVNSKRLARILKAEKPAVVVATEPDSWLVCARLKRKLGIKVVADIREVYEDRFAAFPRLMQKPGVTALKMAMKWMSGRTDEIIHMSEERKHVYSYLRKKGVVVAYYPDKATFEGINGNTSENNIFTIMHAGALREKYGANQLIHALKLLKERDIAFKLIVPGGVAGRIKELELLEQLQATGHVTLLGQLPFHEVLALFTSSNIGVNLVLPTDQSHYLAQPRKLYEYIGAGLPFVGAAVPTIKKVAEKWGCGTVVDPYQPSEIADAIAHYVQDRAALKQAAVQAKTAFRQEYNWEGQEPVFINIFKQLTSSQ